MQTNSAPPTLRLLLDTNVVIALEPFDGPLEAGLHAAVALQRLASEQGHGLFVHPATRDDLLQGDHSMRHHQRLAVLAKYQELFDTPVSHALSRTIGEQAQGSNGQRDLRILSGLHSGAVNYLVTNDRGLRRWAGRVGLGHLALTVTDAVDLLQGLSPALTEPPPLVERLPAYALDADDSIFASIRDAYAGFDAWMAQVRQDHLNRRCLVVRPSPGGPYAAIGLAKLGEPGATYDLPDPVIKVSTFKVGEAYRGQKYSELLLKALFQLAAEHDAASMYVEVFQEQDILINQLINFGFIQTAHRTSRGEIVLAKLLHPQGGGGSNLGPLDYHIRYGPPALTSRGATFIVPIQPRWHTQLFPDAPVASPSGQLALTELGRTVRPWGNALRKAYLCHSKIGALAPGDTLLFYRSQDRRSVDAVGVVENTLRSADPAAVLAFVGQRTVYSAEDIRRMCGRPGGLLAILFRQDRFLEPPWSLVDLQVAGAVRSWPQSIAAVREEGLGWVHDQLNASP